MLYNTVIKAIHNEEGVDLMSNICIICGKDESDFFYSLKGITVCLCAEHINHYISKELSKEYLLHKSIKISNINYKKRFDKHRKGFGAS